MVDDRLPGGHHPSPGDRKNLAGGDAADNLRTDVRRGRAYTAGGGMVGNALWTGVDLREVLDMAGVPQPEAGQIVGG